MTDATSSRLSVLLMKEGVADPLKVGVMVHPSHVAAGAKLATKQVAGVVPKWRPFVESLTSASLSNLRNAHAAAVLIIPVDKRVFAVTFGQGRWLLRPGTWEEDFGLTTTLNAVDPATLRSVDKKEIDPLTRHTKVNASGSGELEAFGFNPAQDMLRAVTGNPVDPTLGTRMTGSDALAVNIAVGRAGIAPLLRKYLALSASDAFRTKFPQVGKIKEVRDKAMLAKLDGLMVVAVGSNAREKQWLAAPNVDWSIVEGFRYRPSGDLLEDIHWDTFLPTLRANVTLSPEHLRNRSVLAYDGSDAVVGEWRMYDCIYSEVEHAGGTYLLTEGKWYATDKAFLDETNQEVARLSSPSQLPPYTQKNEGDYNLAVAKSDPTKYALFDKKLIPFGGGQSKVEFCDLLASSGRIIHVKRYSGSATLSHLFAQGVTSALTFLGSQNFVREVERRLPPKFASPWTRGATPDSKSLTVVYAIASKSSKPIQASLPFFSKVALVVAAQQLRGARIPVVVEKIQA